MMASNGFVSLSIKQDTSVLIEKAKELIKKKTGVEVTTAAAIRYVFTEYLASNDSSIK